MPSGREIRQLREAAGLSQRELSAMLDYTSSYVAFLESDRRRMSAELVLKWLKTVPRLQKLVERREKTLNGVRKAVAGVEGEL